MTDLTIHQYSLLVQSTPYQIVETPQGNLALLENGRAVIDYEYQQTILQRLARGRRELRELTYQNELPTLLRDAEWRLANNDTRVLRGLSSGVYIFGVIDRDLIKIGMTETSLSNRVNSSRKVYGGHENTWLIAVAITPQPRKLETALHAEFADHRHGTYELFDRVAVMAFLQRLNQEGVLR